MSTTVEVTIELSVIHCAECSMAFGVPDRFETDRRRDHRAFYCPAGHSNVFQAETEEEKLRRILQVRTTQYEDKRREVEDLKRRREADERRAAKARQRAGAGVCPVEGCKRHFLNVKRHMAAKHPGYAAK